MTNITQFFQTLRNQRFARLYMAQTISLVGDSLTWVGLALLTFELAGKNSGVVLSTALTIRVMVFVLLAPLAGVIADYFDRKRLMAIAHLSRMLIVCLLPFVTQVWQIYAIVLALNIFNAFFTPTYKATIPMVTGKDEYPQAIALSGATYQLLGVLGPGLAGSVAAFMGARQVFFLDGLTFLIAGILIVTLSGQLKVDRGQQTVKTVQQTLQNLRMGTAPLFIDPFIRYALAMQLVTSIAGAQILVNTINYVQGTLKLGNVEYGWVMAAFGIGATIASVTLINLSQRLERMELISLGALAITVALIPANIASLEGLLVLWVIAGAGQSLVELPTQTLIADRIPVEVQGRVYGAHFAWSHLWWAFSYPLAGWLGSQLAEKNFFYGSLIGFTLLTIVYLTLKPRQQLNSTNLDDGSWHEHEHTHDELHMHEHSTNLVIQEPHNHLHFHHAPHHHEPIPLISKV